MWTVGSCWQEKMVSYGAGASGALHGYNGNPGPPSVGLGVFLFLHSACECAKGEHLARMCVCACVRAQSCLFATRWAEACQASSVHGDCPGKNTGVGCHSLLQWIFPTQGSNLCLRHWQADSLPLSHLGILPGQDSDLLVAGNMTCRL